MISRTIIRGLEHPAFQKLLNGILHFRIWINFSFHLLLFAAAYGCGVALSDDLIVDRTTFVEYWTPFVPLVFIRAGLFAYHDLYQGLWRYVSFEDLLNIIRASVIGSLVFVAVGAFMSAVRLPLLTYVLELGFCIFATGGMRMLVRNWRERFLPQSTGEKQQNIIVAGPIRRTQQLVKDLIGDPFGRYLPMAIIDPEKNESASTTRVADVPIYPLGRLLERKGRFSKISAVVLCWPEASRKETDRLVDQLKYLQVPFKKVPPVEDILEDKVSINDIREVEIEDLLERPSVVISLDKIGEKLNGKTILVTGGGGSIGSEICRQVAGFEPKKLVVVERSENNLYDLQWEIKNRFPDLPFHASISTINDGTGMSHLVRSLNVDVIFHAAAYKHVPLMEAAPLESAYNNIVGTYNMVQAAMKGEVERFVMISTDKAVNPTNVMGVTKRIAEQIVKAKDKGSRTRFMTVRFGNVLGSAGSVIPIFKKQILKGGPVTVTHPEIVRYFMTIPEAVQLVLQAGCMGGGGEVFVLDMGKPIRILQLAEKLITLSGKIPHEDIEIRFSGLRPGEKMYEELFNSGEKLIHTEHARIKAADCELVSIDDIDGHVEEIKRIIARQNQDPLLEKFCSMVPSYQCQLLEAKSEAGGNNDWMVLTRTQAV